MPERRVKRRAITTPERAFGEVIQRLRRAKGLSQEQLGFESGHHRTYVSLIERGGRSPSLRTILALASALGIPPSRLLQEVEAHLAHDQARERLAGRGQR